MQRRHILPMEELLWRDGTAAMLAAVGPRNSVSVEQCGAFAWRALAQNMEVPLRLGAASEQKWRANLFLLPL